MYLKSSHRIQCDPKNHNTKVNAKVKLYRMTKFDCFNERNIADCNRLY